MAWYEVTGTVSDIAMAVAAVYAAWNAKSWFFQRSHTKGFDKAEDVLHKTDSLFFKTKESIIELHNTLEYMKFVSDGLAMPDNSFLKKYENLRELHVDLVNEVVTLKDDAKLIERWSIKLKQEKPLYDILDSIFDANASATNAYGNARACIYNITCMGKDEFDLSFLYYKSSYEEFLKELTQVERTYKEFVAIKFTDMFKVK